MNNSSTGAWIICAIQNGEKRSIKVLETSSYPQRYKKARKTGTFVRLKI
jgi:hypothetical protein